MGLSSRVLTHLIKKEPCFKCTGYMPVHKCDFTDLETGHWRLFIIVLEDKNPCPSSATALLGGIDGCLLVEPPALVLVFIYQARLNAIYTAKLS